MVRKFMPYVFWLYTLAILIASVIPSWSTKTQVGLGLFTFRLDYWLHFFAYGGLCVLYILFNFSRLTETRFNSAFYRIFWIVIFAAFTEIMQLFIPGRSLNLKDFIADTSGIACGIIFCLIFRKLIYRIIHNIPRALLFSGQRIFNE